MTKSDIKIKLRIASSDDAKAISQIYKPFAEDTAVSFEYIAPDEKEFKRRITEKLITYPFVVAEVQGEVVGYCYASSFMPRPAYIHSVETSLYVKDEFHGLGIGRCLYNALEEILLLQNVISLNACIAFADNPDNTLNNNSMMFHSKMGYRYVGRFNAAGFKFGRFYDMIWMEKLIAKPQSDIKDFIAFSKVHKQAQEILDNLNSFYNKTVN